MARDRSDGEHRFGGNWTTRKLDVLAGYLQSYTTALKNQPKPQRPFRKLFVDAFAGTGYREARRDSAGSSQDALVPDLVEQEPQSLLDGSARIALKTDPPFDRYVFIERSAERCVRLEALKSDFPNLAERIAIRHGDANTEIQELCSEDWGMQRAVIFLDPYGMQVEWATIEAIARTKAIDLWILFPFGTRESLGGQVLHYNTSRRLS